MIRPPLAVASAAVALAGCVVLAGCGASAAGTHAGGAAGASRRIAAGLRAPVSLQIVPRRLAADPPLRAALIGAGVLAHRGGRDAFTRAGLAASAACGDYDDPDARCFPVARRRLAALGRTVRTPLALDSGGEETTAFTFRAVPASPLGARLAHAGALRCEVARGRSAVWRGGATLAAGELSTPAIAHARDLDVVRADCPRLAGPAPR